MDKNIKDLVGKHINRGIAKMHEWSEPDDHIKNTYIRSMRFLAQDIVDELAGNTGNTKLNIDEGNNDKIHTN